MVSIIEELQRTIESYTSMRFFYGTLEALNVEITRQQDANIVWCVRLSEGTIEEDGGQLRERLPVALFFCRPSEQYDIDSIEAEQVLQNCRADAFGWLTRMRRDERALRIVSLNGTSRAYNETDDFLLAYVLNVTLEEVEGYTKCDLPQPVSQQSTRH